MQLHHSSEVENFLTGRHLHVIKPTFVTGHFVAPAYANVLMGEIEKLWHTFVDREKIAVWYRFIDDIFLVWNGSEKELDEWVGVIEHTKPSKSPMRNQNTKPLSLM